MENASKALIIAAAVLLSILIIALGMQIYNNAQSSISDTGLDSQKIGAFNSQFEAYAGKQTGTACRTLITNIRASNNLHEGDTDLQIACTEDPASFDSTKKYTVTFTYNSTTGVINGCNIS